MKNQITRKEFGNINQSTHLPYAIFLKEMDPREILGMGIGTFRYKTNDDGRYWDNLIQMLKKVAAKYGKEWTDIDFIARVEGGHGENSRASIYGKTRKHLHFLIFKKGILDEDQSREEVDKALKTIKRAWAGGMCLLQEYDEQKHRWNGVSYVLKTPQGIRADDYGDGVRMSIALWERTLQKEAKTI